MTETIHPDILQAWNMYLRYGAYTLLFVGLGVLLFYAVRLLLTLDYKKRYDFISLREIIYLRNIAVVLLLSGVLYVGTTIHAGSWLLVALRVLAAVVVAFFLHRGLRFVLRYYYPFYIETRLKKLRYKPRISPEGRKMKLLTEEEEDVYLDEGMQAEEDVLSVDYDVWVDETSGYTKIEKYYGRMHAEQCPECQYYTMRVEKELISTVPTEDTSGVLTKHSRCRYCGHQAKNEFKLAKLSKQKKQENMIAP